MRSIASPPGVGVSTLAALVLCVLGHLLGRAAAGDEVILFKTTSRQPYNDESELIIAGTNFPSYIPERYYRHDGRSGDLTVTLAGVDDGSFAVLWKIRGHPDFWPRGVALEAKRGDPHKQPDCITLRWRGDAARWVAMGPDDSTKPLVVTAIRWNGGQNLLREPTVVADVRNVPTIRPNHALIQPTDALVIRGEGLVGLGSDSSAAHPWFSLVLQPDYEMTHRMHCLVGGGGLNGTGTISAVPLTSNEIALRSCDPGGVHWVHCLHRRRPGTTVRLRVVRIGSHENMYRFKNPTTVATLTC